jgi:hypothetical protein
MEENSCAKLVVIFVNLVYRMLALVENPDKLILVKSVLKVKPVDLAVLAQSKTLLLNLTRLVFR